MKLFVHNFLIIYVNMYIYNFLIHFFKAVDQPKERLQSDQTTPSAPDFQDLSAGRNDESSLTQIYIF